MLALDPLAVNKGITLTLLDTFKVQKKKRLLIQALFLFLAMSVFLFISYPGLKGGFVLDDWPNLSALEKVHNWQGVKDYTLSGPSSSVGRQVAYFSFALQAQAWPDRPFPFKAANLLIHIGNALMLYACCYVVAVFLKWRPHKAIVFAALSTFLWLFLPLHASTVFYTVQRMTLLSGLFTLLGLLGLLLGCLLDAKGSPIKGRWLATTLAVLAYVLGILSKENAVLLGVFMAIVYFFIIRDKLQSSRAWWDIWVVIMAIGPVLLTASYLFSNDRYLAGYNIRDFDVRQRFYTQWRILWDYLAKILFPTPWAINILNDGYPSSRSLLSPWTTLLSGLMLLFLIACGWLTRKQYPFILFGVLWYLGGHLLESTVLGLELYFEHRNYLPSLGITVALAWGIIALWPEFANIKNNSLRSFCKISMSVLIGCYALWYSLVLSIEAHSWQDKKSFVMASLKDRPNSLRAHQEATSYLANIGDYKNAVSMLYEIDNRWPNYPSTYVWLMYFKCLDPNIPIPDDKEITLRLKSGKFDRGAEEAFYEIYQTKQKYPCSTLSWSQYRHWISVLMSNPQHPPYGINDNLLRLQVFSLIEENNLQQANQLLAERDENSMNIDLLRLKMDVLYMAGKNDKVLALIDRVKKKYKNNRISWEAKGAYFLNIENKIINETDE